MKEYTINVLKALDAVHAGLGKSMTFPEGSVERERAAAYANSAMSATMVYARAANPPVQKRHYDAVEALYKELGIGDAPKEMVDQGAA